jgi:hypothetical protein
MMCKTPECPNEALPDRPLCIDCLDMFTAPLPLRVLEDGTVIEDPNPSPCIVCGMVACECRCPVCTGLWERCTCRPDSMPTTIFIEEE